MFRTISESSSTVADLVGEAAGVVVGKVCCYVANGWKRIFVTTALGSALFVVAPGVCVLLTATFAVGPGRPTLGKMLLAVGTATAATLLVAVCPLGMQIATIVQLSHYADRIEARANERREERLVRELTCREVRESQTMPVLCTI